MSNIGMRLGLVVLCVWVASGWTQLNEQIAIVGAQGNQRIESAAILKAANCRAGDVLTSERVQAAIRNVYALGYFDDVAVDWDAETRALIIRVSERKVVRSIEFSGNEKGDVDDLKAKIKTKAFSLYDPFAVQQDIEQIRSFYNDKGFYLADVDPQIEEVTGTEVKLTFQITENKKVRIRRIRFLGNRQFSDRRLKKQMLTRERDFLSFLSRSGTYREDMLAQDRQILRNYYGQFGYVDAKIGVPSVQLLPDKQSMVLTMTVEEGDLYTISSVDVSGELIKNRSELLSEIAVKPGSVASTLEIQKDIAKLSQIYADQGYAYVNVIPQDARNADNKTIDLNYLIQPGKKVYIDRIRYVGNSSTRDKVLRQEMRIVEGDLYNLSNIQASRANIERLALYEEVRLSTPRGVDDEHVDVVIEVKERQTGTFSIGAGFNTLESFQIIGRVEKRNLFGYGVDLTLDARIGGLTQAFNLQFRDEYFLDSRWGLTVNAFNIDRRYTDFDLTSRGGSVGFDYPIYEKGLEKIRLGVTYSLIDQILSDLRPTVENLFSSGVTSSVTASISRDTRNRVFEPSKGSLLMITEEVAGGYMGGSNSFSKLQFDGRWFFPVAEQSKIGFFQNSVFALHFQVGYVSPLASDERVPLFERFFPGGILNIRGFPLRSLGPKLVIASSSDPTSLTTSDFVVGGNKQLIFNAEYIFPIIQPANIKGVIFFDMGNAFDKGESLFTLTGQRQSVGFGVRWFSPVGPLRFEWGIPLDRKADESSLVFDFTIGTLF